MRKTRKETVREALDRIARKEYSLFGINVSRKVECMRDLDHEGRIYTVIDFLQEKFDKAPPKKKRGKR